MLSTKRLPVQAEPIAHGGDLKNAPMSFQSRSEYTAEKSSCDHLDHTKLLTTIGSLWSCTSCGVFKKKIMDCLWFSSSLLSPVMLTKRPGQQIMAPLPQGRLAPTEPPFTNISVDYFGPLIVIQRCCEVKCYGCLLTCLIIQAVDCTSIRDRFIDLWLSMLCQPSSSSTHQKPANKGNTWECMICLVQNIIGSLLKEKLVNNKTLDSNVQGGVNPQ